MIRTIASSASVDGIIRLIAHYWYTTPDRIDIVGGLVYQSGAAMDGYIVVRRCGRWHFRMA
jgi:hypothetical protein